MKTITLTNGYMTALLTTALKLSHAGVKHKIVLKALEGSAEEYAELTRKEVAAQERRTCPLDELETGGFSGNGELPIPDLISFDDPAEDVRTTEPREVDISVEHDREEGKIYVDLNDNGHYTAASFTSKRAAIDWFGTVI